MRRLCSPAALVLLCLMCAVPASAQLPLPPLPLPGLPTHIDPYTIGITVEVPGPSGGPTGKPLDTAVPVDANAVAQSEPSDWCGNERATDDTADAAANGTFHYHLIYAYASDGVDRFESLASQLQSDAFQASGLLEREYGRAIRYDMGTSCGSQYVDISSLRLPQSTADLQSLVGTRDATFNTVESDLNQAGFPTIGSTQATSTYSGTTNYLVWLDGPAPAGCGQGALYQDAKRDPTNDNNVGGKLALVFRNGDSFCDSNADRHEIGHTLGAVQPQAPHYDGSGHCNDQAGDTMCISSQPIQPSDFQALYFDSGDDDYWDPPNGQLGWWTTNLSQFICPGVACDVPGGINARTAPTTTGIPGPGSGSTTSGGASGTPTVTVSSSHKGRTWHFKVRLKGTGRARVTVSCKSGKKVRRLVRKTVKLPATVRGKGRCDARPRAVVKRLP